MSNPPQRADRETVMHALKQHLKTVFGLSDVDVLSYFHEKTVGVSEKVVVPVSIFNETVSPLEAIVKYLREVKGLRLFEIAKLTGRDQRAIGVTYRAALKKMPELYTDEKSEYGIPVDVLADRTLTVAENVVKVLKDEYNLTYHEVATLIKRDDRTVWTLYNRMTKKKR